MGTQYIRPAKVCEIVGISPATLWNWCKAKKTGFPQPYRLSPRFTVFDAAELDSFMASMRPMAPCVGAQDSKSGLM